MTITTLTRFRRCLLLACGALLFTLTAVAQPPTPRQVILIIGDGMDDQQLTIARNYLAGASGQLLLDTLPFRGVAQVLTVAEGADGKPVYVADSANTATSMATGVVTSRGRIGTGPTDEDLTTIIELASAAGLATGLVTTASVTDATPASFIAHISQRLCENPQSMVDYRYNDIPLADCQPDLQANGGPGSIAEQLATAPLDVLLGGGHKHFAMAAERGEQSVLALAGARGYRVLTRPEELAEVRPGERLLGLFAPSHLPVRLRGEGGRGAEEPETSFLHLFHDYLGSVTLPEPMRCEGNPDFAGAPTLKQMTEVALAQLAAASPRGFFLMVESASIDKQSHQRQPCGAIGELAQLDEALRSALDFAAEHPETLVIVTADHTHAAQLIPDVSLFARYPVPTYTPGKLARVVTPEGGIMAINYATTNFVQEEHSGANVPVYANRSDQLTPFIRQPDLFEISKAFLGLP
jgi:alkaline phosphatase